MRHGLKFPSLAFVAPGVNIQPLVLNPVVSAWGNRVVTNGGVKPNDAVMLAVNTFYLALVTANIHTKFKTLNVVAPSNLTAAYTPLIVGVGSDPYTVGTGASARPTDLTVAGIKGAAFRYFSTGVNFGTSFSNNYNCGMTVMVSANAGETGKWAGGCTQSAGDYRRFGIQVEAGAGTTSFFCGDVVGGSGNYYVSGLGTTRKTGYFSGNTLSSTNVKYWFARSDVAHYQMGTWSAVDIYKPTPILFWLAAGGTQQVPENNNSSDRHSFFAVHTGLTSADSLALYNAVYAMRTEFGGGAM